MCDKKKEKERGEGASLKCYIHMYVNFCYFFRICDLRNCRLSVVWIFAKSHRILPLQNTIPPASSSIEHERNRALCTFAASGNCFPPPSSSLATLISKIDALSTVIPTGWVHWFTLWATGLLLQRVYECTRMNKTRVVRLVGIDSGPRCCSSWNRPSCRGNALV